MNKHEFFANISNRLRRPMPTTAPVREVMGAPIFWQSAPPYSDAIGRFTIELELLGGQVTVCDSLTELHQAIEVRLADLQPAKVGVWGGDFVSSHELDELLAPYPTVHWGPDGVAEFENVDVSITGCAYAIADTGSIVLLNEGVCGRSAAVLPTIHMVIIQENQILSRMGEVLTRIAEMRQDLPASIHFISGPSRSSDIENDQTIGIHGPAAVMAFVLRSS